MADRPETPSNSTDRARRNREILAARRAGTPWAIIARRFGLSERQARRAHDEALRASEVGTLDPERLVVRLVRANIRAVDAMEGQLDSADNSAARVGSARAIASISTAIVDLLDRAGLLPPAGLSALWQADVTAEALVEAFERLAEDHGVAREEVAAALERAASTTAVAVFDEVAA